MWPNHRLSLGKLLKKSIPRGLLFFFWVLLRFSHQCEVQLVGTLVRRVLVNQGFTVKGLVNAW